MASPNVCEARWAETLIEARRDAVEELKLVRASLTAVAQVARSWAQLWMWIQLSVGLEEEMNTYVRTLMERPCLQACCACKLPSIGK
jgi:hypothetical protein